MAKNYILDGEDDSFTFSIRDKNYSFKYPTTGQMKEIIVQFQELDAAGKPKDDAEKKVLEDKAKALDEQLRSYITPIDHDYPIGEALDNESVVTARHFNKMLREEIFNQQ